MSATVTASKPRRAKSFHAARVIASRVSRFFRSRSPSVAATNYTCYKLTVAARQDAIEVTSLEKSFGEVEAVRGVSFEVASGEVFGFLGPNGAGKTTTINMLCTLTKPTGGSARVAGHDVVTERDDVRRHIGRVFQDPTLDGYLTAEQNLRLHAELYGVEGGLVA